MAQHEYKCQSCFHRIVCPEYHPETYSCVHHLDEADVAPRAEVAREIFDLIEDECLAYPIQEGHPTILVDARNYNELKKKYTE